MGTSQARPSSSPAVPPAPALQRSASQPCDAPAQRPAPLPPLQRATSHPDGPAASPAPFPPSRAPADQPTRVKYLQSLDFSLKHFLRASNLPGLEYRLRLAGFYTVTDLLGTDVSELVSSGFTALMARRLLLALDEYVCKQLERRGALPLPFQLVRPGGKISSEPTDKMKAVPTFGKRNVKRASLPEGSRKQTSGSAGSFGQSSGRSMAVIRLMEEELPPAVHFPHSLRDLEEGGGGEGVGPGGADEPDFRSAEWRRRSLSFNSAPLPEPLRRTLSVPADYCWNCPNGEIWDTDTRVRHYSCPPSLSSTAISTVTAESLVSAVAGSEDAGEACASMQQLLIRCRWEEGRREAVRVGGVEAVLVAMTRYCEVADVAELCCRLLSLLCREDEGTLPPVPPGAVSTVLLAMNCHPAVLRVQVQGCLAISSLGRLVPGQCKQLLLEGGVPTIAAAMETFKSAPTLLVSALTALSVALASGSEARLYLVSEHGYLLDYVISAMQQWSAHLQLLEYAIAFLAMLLCEVSVQMESGVVQLVVEQVCAAMATVSHNSHVTTWACKVFSHAASNSALVEWKLAGRCCEQLVEALRLFPDCTPVQTWASYALLQLAALHKEGVVGLLREAPLPTLTPRPPPSLGPETRHYLVQLHQLTCPDSMGLGPGLGQGLSP